MVWSNLGSCAILEAGVVLFQIMGVLSLAFSRLIPSTLWGIWGRIGFVVALVGLGVAGALCGRHDSEFALFAGGTMTLLLIGMTVGSSPSDLSLADPSHVTADGPLAA